MAAAGVGEWLFSIPSPGCPSVKLCKALSLVTLLPWLSQGLKNDFSACKKRVV